MYVCICMFMYACICMHVYVCMCLCMCVYVCVYVCMYICVYAYMYMYVCIIYQGEIVRGGIVLHPLQTYLKDLKPASDMDIHCCTVTTIRDAALHSQNDAPCDCMGFSVVFFGYFAR